MEAPPLERKLAAILAADVVGYSRLMHEDEERTLLTLTRHRAIVDTLIEQAKGQVFGTAGDSVLAEFPSVVQAFNCAVTIQRALRRANADLPEDQRMHLRIGINVGDVMVKDGDIFGDGVNIAARLEALAEPEGICVTRGVRDHMRDRVDADFEDLGEQSVKNIARPVRVYRAVFDIDADAVLIFVADPGAPNAPPSLLVEDIAASPVDAAEVAFWESMQTNNDINEYRIYLDRYPNGAFVELARARLETAVSIEEDPSVEVSFWETIRESDNQAMINAYIKRYPMGNSAA